MLLTGDLPYWIKHLKEDQFMTLQDNITAKFKELYNEAPALVVRAPGRVNLIGEHTDYNDGFVMPLAINRAVWIAARPRTDTRVQITSLDFDDPIDFDLSSMTKAEESPSEYVKGVAWALQQHGETLRGWEGVMQGDVPIGAGLSSSAALELATARIFAAVSGFAWDAPLMAQLSQKAENLWVGVNCGIMDQMISATGKAGHAIVIDCRSLELAAAPLPKGAVIVVLDTNTRRGLVDSAYNERRSQCEAAAAFFEVKALRDITVGEFETRAGELTDVVRRRARHVVTENDRVLQARTAMQMGNLARLGELMYASHTSLRDDFEVSSDALNVIVECARQHSACYGARMTGAGFGGCAVALVKADAAEDFAAKTSACYEAETGKPATVYVSQASDGAGIVS
jgi:galactokinase